MGAREAREELAVKALPPRPNKINKNCFLCCEGQRFLFELVNRVQKTHARGQLLKGPRQEGVGQRQESVKRGAGAGREWQDGGGGQCRGGTRLARARPAGTKIVLTKWRPGPCLPNLSLLFLCLSEISISMIETNFGLLNQ